MKVPNQLTLRSLIKLINLLKLISREVFPAGSWSYHVTFLKEVLKVTERSHRQALLLALKNLMQCCREGHGVKNDKCLETRASILQLQGAVFCQQPESLKDHPEPQKSLQPWCHPPQAETRITQLHAVPWKLWENKCVLFQVSVLIIIYHAAINS